MPKQTNPSELPKNADVLIVGAGVAGLYCAWRLLDQKKSTNVVVVERLNRTGGRLDTDLIKIDEPDGDGGTVRDEEGGMRFNYSMKELMALNGALGLCEDIVPFPMGPPKDSEFGLHYFMRGQEFSVTQAAENNNAKWSELYHLADNAQERGKSPVDIVTDVYQALIKANDDQPWSDSPSPSDWQRFRLDFKWKGKPLNEWQLWGLLRAMGYSEECVTMLSHAIGFEGPFLSLVNAGEAFQILEDFPKDPKYFTFKKGYSTLPNKLCSLIETLGGKVYLSTNVESIHKDADGFRLELTQAPAGDSSSRFVKGGVQASLQASKVILATPAKALSNLYATSSVFNQAAHAEQIWEDFQSVVNMRLLKINLYFEEAWWEDGSKVQPPVQYGPSFTDLPVNAIYPFYSLKGPEDQGHPAALTIYCDFNSTNFWQGLQNVTPMFDSPLQQQHSKPPQVIFPASVAVVKEAMKQIQQVYHVAEVPEPVMTSYRLWGGEEDFGYAYHQWALNANDREVMERLTEPVPGIHTCNEAFSDDQGWVNGSLRSANLVLRKFGIEDLPDTLACCEPSQS